MTSVATTNPTDAKIKAIANSVLSREQAEGAGARVRRSIGNHELRNLDPFLMLDEFIVKQPSGFPDHPHRGFETVTYMLAGAFEHEDFEGHRGIIGPGDLQWMTAGRGIVHAEMPRSESGRGLQLWVNLPASAKMMPPRYQEHAAADVPLAASPDGRVRIKVIAGSSYGVEAKVRTITPIFYLDVTMDTNASFSQNVPEGYTTFAYVLDGAPVFGPETTAPSQSHSTIVFDRVGDTVRATTSDSPARFVLIAGKPINEPIVQHGPFVMNTQSEIHEAIMDFQLGRNGFEKALHWTSEISRSG